MKYPNWYKRFTLWLSGYILVPVAYHMGTVHYLYHGDEVFRANGKWISLGFENSCDTLRELDEWWTEYFKACEEREENNENYN